MFSKWIVAAGIAVVLLAGLYLGDGGTTPEGQPALADLHLDAFKAQFNEAAGSTRVILLISPSCPYCLRGAADFERVLQSHAKTPLAVFAVWQPILPTDWGRPGTLALRRLSDTRVRQYWDADHRVAVALNSAGETNCCYEKGVPWDSMAVFEPGSPWGDSLPKPVLFDGIIMDVVDGFEAVLDGGLRNEPTGGETRVR